MRTYLGNSLKVFDHFSLDFYAFNESDLKYLVRSSKWSSLILYVAIDMAYFDLTGCLDSELL